MGGSDIINHVAAILINRSGHLYSSRHSGPENTKSTFQKVGAIRVGVDPHLDTTLLAHLEVFLESELRQNLHGREDADRSFATWETRDT